MHMEVLAQGRHDTCLIFSVAMDSTRKETLLHSRLLTLPAPYPSQSAWPYINPGKLEAQFSQELNTGARTLFKHPSVIAVLALSL